MHLFDKKLEINQCKNKSKNIELWFIRKIKDGGIGIIDTEIKIKATEALLDIDIKT